MFLKRDFFVCLKSGKIDEGGNQVILKILVENDNEINEHGLSIHIEYDDLKILFDAGQSDLYQKNAKKLGIDLTKIDLVVLSHGHYDHGNGLKYLSQKILLCHPKVFSRRFREDGSYVGLNLTKKEAMEDFLKDHDGLIQRK
jgi:7,8-dihydropterin-6-yl-methyl-4-(beta-D-ribofuranosyl)aminobenzene 5'-phosphate synthase